MQLVQLFTFVGLALSHVRALRVPPVIPVQDEKLVHQIVTLITRPDIIVKNTPEFKSLEDLASQSPLFFDHQIHQGAAETLTSLRSVGGEHTSYVLNSIVGYHSATNAARSKIYRNSIYSRVVDLVHSNPETSTAHLQSAYKSLLLSLQQELVHLEQQHLKPMGEQKVIEKLEQLFARFNEENKEELHRYTEHILSQLPSTRPFERATYLTKEQVNDALKATNNPETTPAMLVDGFKSLALQQAHALKTYAPKNPPKAYAPNTHANFALHNNPQPVVAAA